MEKLKVEIGKEYKVKYDKNEYKMCDNIFKCIGINLYGLLVIKDYGEFEKGVADYVLYRDKNDRLYADLYKSLNAEFGVDSDTLDIDLFQNNENYRNKVVKNVDFGDIITVSKENEKQFNAEIVEQFKIELGCNYKVEYDMYCDIMQCVGINVIGEFVLKNEYGEFKRGVADYVFYNRSNDKYYTDFYKSLNADFGVDSEQLEIDLFQNNENYRNTVYNNSEFGDFVTICKENDFEINGVVWAKVNDNIYDIQKHNIEMLENTEKGVFKINVVGIEQALLVENDKLYLQDFTDFEKGLNNWKQTFYTKNHFSWHILEKI